MKNRYNRVTLSADEKTIYLSHPSKDNGQICVSPFATFSTESFFNNSFTSEKISYSEEVPYTTTALNGRGQPVTVHDHVVSHNNEFYLIEPTQVSYQKITGSSATGSFLLLFLFIVVLDSLDFGPVEDGTKRSILWLDNQNLDKFYVILCHETTYFKVRHFRKHPLIFRDTMNFTL